MGDWTTVVTVGQNQLICNLDLREPFELATCRVECVSLSLARPTPHSPSSIPDMNRDE